MSMTSYFPLVRTRNSATSVFLDFGPTLAAAALQLRQVPGVAELPGDVHRNPAAGLDGKKHPRAVDERREASIREAARRLGVKVARKPVNVPVDLDEHAPAPHADLHGLVYELPPDPGFDQAEQGLYVLRIKPNTPVGDEPSHRPGIVGSVDGVQRQGELYAVGPQRVFRIPAGDEVLRPPLIRDPLLLDRVRDHPGRVRGLAPDPELRFRGRPVLTAQACGEGEHGAADGVAT